MTRPSSPPRLSSRLANAVRARGVAAIMRDRAKRLSRALHADRTLLLYRAAVAELRRDPARLDPGQRFHARAVSLEEGRVFRDADAHALAELHAYVRVALGGEQLLLGFVDDRLAAFNIVAVNTVSEWPLTETRSALPLLPTDAVFISGYVLPAYRGRHLFRTMYGVSADNAAARGATHLWTWCDPRNHPSRKTIEAVGFSLVETHSRRTVLGLHGALRRQGAGAAPNR